MPQNTKKNNQEPKKLDLRPLRYMGVVGQLGITIALPLVFMIFLAQWIMTNYIDSVWVLIFLIISGLVTGFRNAYRMIMKLRF
ncbi:AtpZ/AtpI family protein [Candidatus Contubernalis alkaliaceticus]|uniref:AtpZ/AtpI family protein n=1 Tax=Candidatus Contubernalis alkaliaceticus TaxID=338645 RepID=UPI001F4C2937|nr:AtpZ/AtpI family protein [Candidatus Contubernalis alkalaceticus]UNC93667.1 AtpZ/AtpI family protein [Candidatus Contubernalis alkalaceticus]